MNLQEYYAAKHKYDAAKSKRRRLQVAIRMNGSPAAKAALAKLVIPPKPAPVILEKAKYTV